MRTEIFMEGRQLDITDDIAALFTYAVDDIRDFGSRNTSFSKTINIPGSGRNNFYFGHSFQFDAYNPTNNAQPNVGSNFNAARAASCIVLADGIQVFKGVIRLLEITINKGAIEYQCAVFGELGGLMSALGNKLLQDLDFSAYDTLWNAAAISGSWTNANTGTGLYFPLIDYGQASTDKVHFKYKAFRPALYVREYLVKMLAAAGYTYDWPQLDTDLMLRLVIPHNGDNLYKLVTQLINRKRISNESFFMQRGLNGAGPTVTSNTVGFPNGAVNSLINFTTNVPATEFIYSGAGTITGALSYFVSGRFYGGDNKLTARFKVQVNGVVRAQHDVKLTAKFTTSPNPFSFGNFGNLPISISNGQGIKISAEIIGTGAGDFRVDVADSSIVFEANGLQSVPAGLGDTLTINNCIPKGVLQKDLLSSIMKMFNLYIIEDSQVRKKLLIRPYPDFYNYSTPLNWSSKLDLDSQISLKPMSEINARYFNFLYEKDGDYLNEQYRNRYAQGYGDRLFDAGASQGLDFVKDKKDVKLVFAGSPLTGFPGTDKYYTAIYKKEGDGTETLTESKIRILQARRITGMASWNLLNDAGGTIGSYTSYGYAGHLNDPVTPTADINFGAPREVFYTLTNTYPSANLFNAYYSAYMAEICDKDSKLLTASFLLSPVDINRLDFRIPLFINGTLWRLNKVIDYDTLGTGLTRCELLKIINIQY
jgi:hypothetical protein